MGDEEEEPHLGAAGGDEGGDGDELDFDPDRMSATEMQRSILRNMFIVSKQLSQAATVINKTSAAQRTTEQSIDTVAKIVETLSQQTIKSIDGKPSGTAGRPSPPDGIWINEPEVEPEMIQETGPSIEIDELDPDTGLPSMVPLFEDDGSPTMVENPRAGQILKPIDPSVFRLPHTLGKQITVHDVNKVEQNTIKLVDTKLRLQPQYSHTYHQEPKG